MNEYDICRQPIATTPEGNRITYQGLQRIFCEILYGCGMIYYPLSALRDTYAMRLLTTKITMKWMKTPGIFTEQEWLHSKALPRSIMLN